MPRARLIRLASIVALLGMVVAAIIVLLDRTGQGASSSVGAASTPTPTIDQWDSQVTNDTYPEVAKYPTRYEHQTVKWTCNLANFFGKDTGDGRNNVGCWEFNGQYDGEIGEGEVILSIPESVDMSTMREGDDVVVRGYVAAAYDGLHPRRPAYAGPVIDVWSLVDEGHDQNAT